MPISHVYNTPTNHDLAQEVHISLEQYVKWSGYFLFLFINRLKITWDRRAYFVERSGICDLSHFINQITSLGKCMLNDYKSTAQNRAAPKVAIMVISRLFNSLIFMCDIHSLLFDETIIVI